MRVTAPALCLAILLAAGSAPSPAQTAAQPPAPACLRTDMIHHTIAPDNRTILFYMHGGDVWKNTLPAACVGLDFPGGFQYTTFHDEVCANSEVIRILKQGNFCRLGAFTPAEPPKKPE